MDYSIAAAVMLAEFMNLRMTVVTAGNTIDCSGGLNLNVLHPAVFQALLLVSRLQKATTAAITVIVGAVGLHIDKIFFPHDGFNHKTQILGDGIPVAFTYNLARILDGKFDF